MRYLALVTIAFSTALAGCDGTVDRVSRYGEVTNVRQMSGGYIHYNLEAGAVTCREHKRRSELACWNTVPKTPQ